MKLFIVAILSGLMSLAFFQQAVRTESGSNLYKNYAALTTGDTVYTKAAQATGGGVDHVGVTGYLVSITFNTTIASDTTQIFNGLGSVGKIITTASPPVLPYTVFYNVRLDTSLVITKTAASNITLAYRITQN